MTDLLSLSSVRHHLKPTGRIWCALTALVTMLAFIALVSTSVSHIHQNGHETQECSICSVVTDQVGSGFAAPALILTEFVFLFALATQTLRSSLHISAPLLPRSCGPPGSV
jgi:TRAP-type C4-dicarboxylate transport system permease small subunit